VQSRKC